jgi:hypothetical protein
MLHTILHRGGNDVAPRPVTGRYLAHAKLSAAQWAFLGADLVTERIKLVKPTLISATYLARSNTAYVQAALKRQEERVLIEAGVLPLAPPPRPALPAPKSAQERVAELAAEVGCSVILDVLAGLEADHVNAAIGDHDGVAINSAAPH